MGKTKHLSGNEKFSINILLCLGISQKKIAESLKRSKSCISKYVKYKDEIKFEQRGRKKLIDERMGRRIRKLVQSKPCTSRYIKNYLDIKVNTQTLRNYMRKNNILWQHFDISCPLTAINRQKRLSFSVENLTNFLNWKSVIFSDEKLFSLDGLVNNSYCWTVKNNQHKLVRRHTKGGSVMVWGAIGFNNKSTLHFINGKLDKYRYREILENYLRPMLQPDSIFQQDNCPCHKADLLKQWFEAENITHLNWPPQSPDLNIIENVWGIMASTIYANGKQFFSKEDLKLAIIKCWDEFDQSSIMNMFQSIPKRLVACINNKGGNIKY